MPKCHWCPTLDLIFLFFGGSIGTADAVREQVLSFSLTMQMRLYFTNSGNQHIPVIFSFSFSQMSDLTILDTGCIAKRNDVPVHPSAAFTANPVSYNYVPIQLNCILDYVSSETYFFSQIIK